tara:strand:- start:263 stop:487 length:225 start_codon:yes stop_codon:yes gene_type:complete
VDTLEVILSWLKMSDNKEGFYMIVNEQYIVEIPNVTTIEEAEAEFHNAGSVDTYYVEHYGWEFEEGDNDHLEEE